MTTRLTPEERADRDMSENALKKEVLALAKKHGWFVQHLSQVNVKRPQRSSSGYPDLTLARGGAVMFFELKRQDGQLEPEQEKWRDNLGFRWYLLRPSDLRVGLIDRLLV